MSLTDKKPSELHIELSTAQTRVDNPADQTQLELPALLELRFTQPTWKSLVFSLIFKAKRATNEPLDVKFSIPEVMNDSQRDELVICAMSAGAKRVKLESLVGATPIRPIITDLDVERLRSAIDHHRSEDPSVLEEELARAEVVPQKRVPADVITMNSRIRILDEVTQERREVTIVYPEDADVKASRVSVLSPLGAGLLGLRKGAGFQWMPPRQPLRKVRVEQIIYQPESAGDWHL